MAKVNENFLKLQGSYLFSTVGKKVAEYQKAHPDKNVIRLGNRRRAPAASRSCGCGAASGSG